LQKDAAQFVIVDRPAALAGRPAGNIFETAAFSYPVDRRLCNPLGRV